MSQHVFQNQAPAPRRNPATWLTSWRELANESRLEDDAVIAIRLAGPKDLEPLRRLIDVGVCRDEARGMLLDLTKPGAPRRVLIASVSGKDVAALHADSGREASDPFEPAATALELLRTRARELRTPGQRHRGRRLARRLRAI